MQNHPLQVFSVTFWTQTSTSKNLQYLYISNPWPCKTNLEIKPEIMSHHRQLLNFPQPWAVHLFCKWRINDSFHPEILDIWKCSITAQGILEIYSGNALTELLIINCLYNAKPLHLGAQWPTTEGQFSAQWPCDRWGTTDYLAFLHF